MPKTSHCQELQYAGAVSWSLKKWSWVAEVLWTQPTYCWWFRNPATQLRLVVYPIINIYLQGGAGFLPQPYVFTFVCFCWCFFYSLPWEITIKLPFGEYIFPTTWSNSMFRVFGMKWTVFGLEFLAPLPSSTCRFILGLCWVSTSLKSLT